MLSNFFPLIHALYATGHNRLSYRVYIKLMLHETQSLKEYIYIYIYIYTLDGHWTIFKIHIRLTFPHPSYSRKNKKNDLKMAKKQAG